MLPVIRPRHLLLLTAALAVAVNVASVTLRLIALPLVQARDAAGAPALDEPFAGFTLLLGQVDADGEANLAAWFSSLLLLLVALTSAGIWLTARREGTPWRWHWLGLGLLFGYVSLDEVAQIHELAIPLMAQVVEARGVLTFAWVVLAAPLVLVLAVLFLPFLVKVGHRTGLLLAVAGTVFVSGALGLELLGGWVFDTVGPVSASYVWVTTVEELLENLGATLALYAVTRHAALTRRPAPRPGADGPATVARGSAEHPAVVDQLAVHPGR